MPHAPSPLLFGLGGIVRWCRVRAGLSQEELGFETGTDRSYVSELERGLLNPSFLKLTAFADALELPLQVLIQAALEAAGDGPPPAVQPVLPGMEAAMALRRRKKSRRRR